MPPAAEKEAPPAAPPQKQSMFSAAGVLVIFILLIVEGVAVYLLAKNFGSSKEGGSITTEKYAEVDLGPISRRFSMGNDAVKAEETFMMEPILVLNPNLEDLEQLKSAMDARKNLYRNKAIEILNRKPPAYFKQPNVQEDLAHLLKTQLNQLLPASKDGHEVIEKVVFKNFSQP